MSFQYNTATSFSEETYLESFVEAVSWTLPSDLQRSLQHLQMLDNESTKLLKRWRDTQDSCLLGVETALLGAYRGGEDDEKSIIPPPSTPLDNGATKRKSPVNSSERKKACYKCRNKKVKCDGKQSFCLLKEEFYNTAISIGANNSGGEGSVLLGDNATSSSYTTDYYSPPQKKSRLSSANNNDDDTAKQSSSTATLPKLDTSRPPTTAELRSALQSRHPHYTRQRETITTMYHQLQQCSREKINTANQLKSMIDMALGRLSRDRTKFEQDLGLSSSSTAATGGVGSGAVFSAAASLNQAGMVGGGDVASAVATSAAINTTATTTATAAIEPHTTTTPSQSTNTNKDLAAIQTTPNSPDWILAKIISYNKYTKMYTLSDEDMASNEIYTIPERQVRPLLLKNNHKWTKGEAIYAVYPDTTSFYPAVVNYCTKNGHVMVQFNDDWDASGVIHEKAIPMQHVMKAP
eukprot:scaffold6822_cov121-Skeletonema_dohrnii-CCMP3373.AAC.12